MTPVQEGQPRAAMSGLLPMPHRVWIVGCGNMAGAMLAGWVSTGALDPANVFALTRSDRVLPRGVEQGRALPDSPLPDIVLLGVKPQQLDPVAAQFADRLRDVPVLISILAGVDEASLAARFQAGAIVRAMPNMGVEISAGVTALHSHSANDEVRQTVTMLMNKLGLVEWVEEPQFDGVTALAGSGPAFVDRFVQAMAGAGEALGIPAEQALRLARATVRGGAELAAMESGPAGSLADRVASPGGSTRAGLDVLDRDGALVRLLADTLAASTRRNAELADAARGARERPQH